MDRHRGDPYNSNSPDSLPYRNPRAPSSRSSSDAPTIHQRRSSPNNNNNHHRGGFSSGGGGRDHRPFDSPPRYPPSAAPGGFRPTGFSSEYQVPLSGQKRGFPFSRRGGSPGIPLFLQILCFHALIRSFFLRVLNSQPFLLTLNTAVWGKIKFWYLLCN